MMIRIIRLCVFCSNVDTFSVLLGNIKNNTLLLLPSIFCVFLRVVLNNSVFGSSRDWFYWMMLVYRLIVSTAHVVI